MHIALATLQMTWAQMGFTWGTMGNMLNRITGPFTFRDETSSDEKFRDATVWRTTRLNFCQEYLYILYVGGVKSILQGNMCPYNGIRSICDSQRPNMPAGPVCVDTKAKPVPNRNKKSDKDWGGSRWARGLT
jgi:hypothetical protein